MYGQTVLATSCPVLFHQEPRHRERFRHGHPTRGELLESLSPPRQVLRAGVEAAYLKSRKEPMSQPFTLRVFVLDGDPEGVRIIDRMNWTGRGIIFPRSKWIEIRSREEFARTGVYILTGYPEGEDDIRTVYIGCRSTPPARRSRVGPPPALSGHGGSTRRCRRPSFPCRPPWRSSDPASRAAGGSSCYVPQDRIALRWRSFCSALNRLRKLL